MKKILMMCAVALAAFCAMADTWTDPSTGITWTYTVSGGKASVGGWNCPRAVPTDTTGAIAIPATLGGCPMTSIGNYAFYGCSGLTSVTIPDSVTSIGDYAFYGCSGLTSVTMPKSVTSIGGYAFKGCSGLTNVTILGGVRSIGAETFYGCCNLRRLVLPFSVTSIGTDAFTGCSGLQDLTAPGLKLGIGSSSVKNLVISDGTKSIEAGAFRGFSSLTSVTIPEGVTSIGEGAFYNCRNLTSVSMPVNAPSIGNDAFRCVKMLIYSDCPIQNATVPGWKCGIPFSKVTKLVITDGTKSILEDAFSGLSGLKSLEMPPSVTSIGARAFKECTGLTRVTIPPSVTSMGDAAFRDCSSLNSVDFEGVPPRGIANVGIKQNAAVRYNIVYESQWLPVIKQCGWTNATSYQPYPDPPTISPESGTIFGTSMTVAMSCASDGADIHYTTNGTVPTMASPVYKKFKIYGRTTVKAIAFYDELHPSEVAVAEYAKGVCGAPVITPPDGTVFEHVGQEVSIAYDGKDGVLRYTLDGSDPTATSPEYMGPLTIDYTTVVKAKVFGKQYFDSGITTATLTRVGVKLATPEITAATSFTGTKNVVVLSYSDSDATVYYTTDGSEPSESSHAYEKPFFVSESCTIKAKAIQYDRFDSDVASLKVVRKWCIGDTMGDPDHAFETSGDMGFVRVDDATAKLGESMKSGDIGDNQKSILSTTVVGPGALSFKWKTSCEEDPNHEWDHAEFAVDGIVVKMIDGETDWIAVSQNIEGDGEHVATWTYVKDDSEKDGGDCLWVSEYVWKSSQEHEEPDDPSVQIWAIVYEDLKGAVNPNLDIYAEGVGMTFAALPNVANYTFAGWTPSSISAGSTGDKIVTANWNWTPRNATVEASITGGKKLNIKADWAKTELAQRFGAGKDRAFRERFGADLSAALTKPTGKRDGADKELSVWHDYVAGTDPTDSNSVFRATMKMVNGFPVIEWEPNLNSNGEERVYTVYGKANLTEDWHSPTNALDRFFKVDVAMPEDESGEVSFDLGGAEGTLDSFDVAVGQPIGELPTPVRAGYDFLGWFTAAEGGNEVSPETIVTADLALYAHWKKTLVHRWSFNGNLNDSVGGQTATIVGNVTTDGSKYKTPGGSSGSAYIDLGNWILPTNGLPVTVEMWVAQDSSVSYGRVFCWGGMPVEGKFTGGYQNAPEWLQLRWDGVCEAGSLGSFGVGTEYYVAMILEPITGGAWKATYYKKSASTGVTLSSASAELKQGWTIQEFQQTDMVLGQTLTTWDSCSKNSYNELRIWNKALSEEELTASAIAGPDADL